MLRTTTILIALLGVIVGCSASHRSAAFDYDTVANDPRRDTDAARELNAEALQLLDEAEYAKAEQTLKRALSADVMFGPAHNNLGLAYFHQSKLYRAAWEFQFAIKLMPHQPEPSNNLGLIFEAVGQFDEAVDAYAEARQLQPDNPELIGNLVRARLRRGDRSDEVRDLLTQLIMKDTRSEWVEWAREKLAMMGGPKRDRPSD